MRLASVLLGVALGAAALLLAWSGQRRTEPAPAVAPPQAPAPRVRSGAGFRSAGTTHDVDVLRARRLVVPVSGIEVSDLRRSFDAPRAGRRHEAIDIPAPHGTRVVAVDHGTVTTIRRSVRGGLTVSQIDATATYRYYYAHLARYAPGLREGRRVGRGQLIGYVGSTGNAPASTPHLHFAIQRIDPARLGFAWTPIGTPIDPFAVWVAD